MINITWKMIQNDGKWEMEKFRALRTTMVYAITEFEKAKSIVYGDKKEESSYIFVVSARVAVMLQALIDFEQEPCKFVRESCNRIGKLQKCEVFRDLYAYNDFVKCYDKDNHFATIEVIIEK